MKKIIITIIILSALHVSRAQSILHAKKGDYVKSKSSGIFTGKWQWQSGHDTITLTLRKVKFHYKGLGIDADALFGNYRYVKDGKEIENTYKLKPDTNKVWIFAQEDQSVRTGSSLILTLTDQTSGKLRNIYFNLSPENNKKAIMFPIPGYFGKGYKTPSNTFPIPEHWEFIKKN